MPADLLRLLPGYFKELEDFRELARAEGAEFDMLAEAAGRVSRNAAVRTADAATVAEHELALGIPPEPGATLEARRRRVLLRLQRMPPYTPRMLRALLAEMVGEGNFAVAIDYGAYALSVSLDTWDAVAAAEARYAIALIIPAHIEWEARQEVSLSGRALIRYGMAAQSDAACTAK
jgi:hypothetical protein